MSSPTETETVEYVIEEAVKVYLEFDAEQGVWTIASSTIDGYGLDSAYDQSDCDSHYMHVDNDSPGHDAAHQIADLVDLPNAEETMQMLAAALGYTLTKTPAP